MVSVLETVVFEKWSHPGAIRPGFTVYLLLCRYMSLITMLRRYTPQVHFTSSATFSEGGIWVHDEETISSEIIAVKETEISLPTARITRILVFVKHMVKYNG